ncbi:MAG: hypothetical protein Q7S52_01240, partial [bacterium]|nr:hypothetical protein [bacterium]
PPKEKIEVQFLSRGPVMHSGTLPPLVAKMLQWQSARWKKSTEIPAGRPCMEEPSEMYSAHRFAECVGRTKLAKSTEVAEAQGHVGNVGVIIRQIRMAGR